MYNEQQNDALGDIIEEYITANTIEPKRKYKLYLNGIPINLYDIKDSYSSRNIAIKALARVIRGRFYYNEAIKPRLAQVGIELGVAEDPNPYNQMRNYWASMDKDMTDIKAVIKIMIDRRIIEIREIDAG